tara:strand:+ start:181 stop:588 length:408 start_codon:yes stop_codon:yes gene_type:complete
MTDQDVAGVFNEVFGETCVDHVDMVERIDRNQGYTFYIAYVHFNEIRDLNAFEQCGGYKFLEKINADEEVKLVYKDPWFWKVRRNTKTKHERRGPRILTEEDTAEFMEYQRKVIAQRSRKQQIEENQHQSQAEEA